MWPMTNPNRITPLTANAAFLPTDVSNSVRAFCVAMSSEHGSPCRDDAGALPLCVAQVHSFACRAPNYQGSFRVQGAWITSALELWEALRPCPSAIAGARTEE